MSGLVRVLVPDDDLEHARQIISRWQAGEFEAGSDSHSSPPKAVPPSREPSSSGPLPALVLSFCAGAILSGAIVNQWYTSPHTNDGYDTNGDGIVDEYVYWRGEFLHRVEQDRNQDGKIDALLHYDHRGHLKGWQMDDDFNGTFEVTGTVGRDGESYQDIDTTGDGIRNERLHFRYDVMYQATYFREDGRTVVKRLYSTPYQPDYAELDTNGDGKMDRFHLYNTLHDVAEVFSDRASLHRAIEMAGKMPPQP
jgi:hypothetical protein